MDFLKNPYNNKIKWSVLNSYSRKEAKNNLWVDVRKDEATNEWVSGPDNTKINTSFFYCTDGASIISDLVSTINFSYAPVAYFDEEFKQLIDQGYYFRTALPLCLKV